MRAREVVDGRFEIEQLAGSGGMGHVYRARDLQTDEIVALKILQNAGAQDSGRLAREAETLATLRLPGVVRYIAHGVTKAGHPYLAMEWLTGETLSQRLARQTLTIEESLAVVSRVAATLGSVHRLGIVHRDLKPSNLLLVDGAIDRVTLIDFGIVRISGIQEQLTMPGAILGTPGYMAPEQARGETQVDARADVFALGCVLYKCLSGRAPFRGARGLAVLVKVLLEEPPQLRWLRDDMPEALDVLVSRMLAKSPEGRPRDGDAVVAEIAALESVIAAAPHGQAPASSLRTPELTTGERKVMCLVLARDALPGDGAGVAQGQVQERVQRLHATAARYQGQLELIEARLPLVVLAGAGAPTDLAVRAARCAIEVEAVLGGAPVSVVTGRAEIASRLPIGDLIDRVVQLLPHSRAPSGAPTIRLDAVTAGLIGSRFEVAHDDRGSWLRAARDEPEVSPQLLGQATACVGRDRELSLIRAEFARCVEESAPSVVLVTGLAGMGKSRLRHELIRSLRESGEPVEIWLGQADPMTAGSSFGLLSSALRGALGLAEGDAPEVRRRKIRARVERHRGLDVGRVTAFLGELLGVPFPEDHDVQLRAARRSPILMGDQLRLAWEDFLHAECRTRPVLLVLEDLHWGDLPTVTTVDGSLRNLKDLPFMVLALGRPEVYELFPKLWDERRGHKIRLAGLPRRACERLVRQVLGEGASAELVAKVVDRADGNPFYLEEQIRAAASGKEDLPETVLAMVQAELDALDIEARRVLRAGSVFGETFRRSAVGALVGSVEIDPMLDELERREVIVRWAGDARSGDPEYRFRHALLREAAYGMLTDHDRRLGHRLAGGWLSRIERADPMALAEHFERGGEQVRAASSYLRAAEQALRGNDLGAAIARAERGVVCGPPAPTVGALRLVQAEAHLWRGEFALAEERGSDAVERLTPGSATWFSAITQVVIAASKRGSWDQVERWLRAARDADAMEGARAARSVCLCAGAGRLVFGGRYAFVDALLDAVERDGSLAALDEVEVAARLHQARSFRSMAGGDPGTCLVGFEATLAAFEQAGDWRNACWARNNVGYYYAELGDYEGAEAALRVALDEAERLGLHDAALGVLHNLGPVLAQQGLMDEAKRSEEEAVATYERLGEKRMEGAARTYLARILLLAGDPEGADREARRAVGILKSTPPLRAFAYGVLARVLLDMGRSVDALAMASEAYLLLMSVGAETGESLVRLIHAEALAANGSEREAALAIASARDTLLTRAAKIKDRVWRERFLGRVPDNVATLDLAKQWLGDEARARS